ncbi:MAG TPA: hypothetical protein VHZ52_06090 [Acidobacteriaceae bacterium]|jgi:hypothetical protein|nr:hypothetical protein [Acidobacteriaceae bacterium]
MPLVLTTHATILCPHGGLGTTTPLSPKWTVNGGYVATEGDSGTLTCIFTPPCVGYTLKSMGLNATKIDGKNVILITDFNQSFTGLPLTITDVHPVTDASTPASIPSGESAPPATPAMADLVAPIVVVVPPDAPFSISTTPSPVVFNFMLTSEYPLRWVLTLINETLGTHMDLTNDALAPGATVTPSGGEWTMPTLNIALTMTPAFIAALTPGTTEIYLTGVSQRGLSGHAIAILNITA